MDKTKGLLNASFWAALGISATVSTVLAGILYARDTTMISFWSCSLVIPWCILVNAITFVFIATCAVMVFLLIVALILDGISALISRRGRIKERIEKWTEKPKARYWFKLHGENDLRLYIFNPPDAKDVYVECSYRDYTYTNEKSYLKDHRGDLELVNRDVLGTTSLLFSGDLTKNDKREITAGISHNGKLALCFGNALIRGFGDGKFMYTVSCKGEYLGKEFFLPNLTAWVTIKNGVLIKIDKEST